MELTAYPDPVLRRKCKPITEITNDVLARVKEMFQVMYDTKGVGLAAPQVGWDAQLCVLNPTPDDPSNEMVCVNPVVVEGDGEAVVEEGCLSLPEVHGNIPRYERIKVVFYDLEGERHEVEAEGLLARIFQHETDHLNGRMIIDRMTPASRLGVKSRLKELEREYKSR